MLPNCGTLPGYMAHIWENTEPCDLCQEWRAQYPYSLTYQPRHGESCVGYHWHRYARVPQCEPCREADRRWARDLRARKAARQAAWEAAGRPSFAQLRYRKVKDQPQA
jgi:hypothetical protein